MRISVIIPCYNVEKYIESCLDSVEKQTYRDIEVICIDDGSTDNTYELIKEKLKWLTVKSTLIRQENKGVAEARNHGLSVAQGEYVQFLDADDFLLHDKLNEQVLLIQKQNNKYDLIIAGYIKRYEDGSEETKSVNKDNIWYNILMGNLGHTSSNLWKLSTLLRHNGFDGGLTTSEEYDLLYRMLREGASYTYDYSINTVVRIRIKGSLSRDGDEKVPIRWLELRRDILIFVNDRNLLENMDDDNLGRLYTKLFNNIKMSSYVNLKKSIVYFRLLIPKQYHEIVIRDENGINYSLYKLFGYSLVQYIIVKKRMIKRRLKELYRYIIN